MKLNVISAGQELISSMKFHYQISDSKTDHSDEEQLREELFSTRQIGRYSKIQFLFIPTNEGLLIAEYTCDLLKNTNKIKIEHDDYSNKYRQQPGSS